MERACKSTKKSKRKTFVSCFLLVAIISIVGLSTWTLSKYYVEVEKDKVVVPTDFFFLSDYLKEANTSGDIPTYYVYSNSIDISISNNDVVNITDQNITFTVNAIDDHNIVHNVKKVNDNGTTENVTGPYSLVGGNLSKYVFRLEATKGDIITLTATSSSPYKKTIQAKFVFKETGDINYYEVEDKTNYSILKLYIGNTVKDIDITYNRNELAPDNTNDIMKDWKNDSDTIVTKKIPAASLEPNSFYSFIFYENDLGTYSTGGKQDFDDAIIMPNKTS